MIDLSRIRSVKTLEEMKSDLTEFITNPIMLQLYIEDYQWEENDYNDDKEEAQYLLEKVEQRIKSLNHLSKRQDSPRSKKSGKAATSSAQ